MKIYDNEILQALISIKDEIRKEQKSEMYSLKSSISQDLDRRNDYMVQQVTINLNKKIDEIFEKKIEPLQSRVNSVEKKIWFFSGVSSVISGLAVFFWKKIFN